MGLLSLLVSVWVIVIIVEVILEQKYKAQLKALIDEVNELRQKQETEILKDYQTNYQGKSENETFTWQVENKK
jgi:hypothetical protein